MSHEAPSFHQIEEQQDSGHRATVLVPRSNGEITVGTYAGENPKKPGTYLVDVMMDHQGKRVQGEREVTAEGLSDATQESLAEQLAGKKLKMSIGHAAMPMEANQAMNSGLIDNAPEQSQPSPETDPSKVRESEIVATLADLMEDLSADDKRALHNYAVALYEHEISYAMNAMSPDLKANHSLKIKTKDLYDELKQIRAAR